MQADSQWQGEELPVSQEPTTQPQSINFISLSHLHMHKIVHDSQALLKRVQNLNHEAVLCLENKEHHQALLLLSDAQKLLQYAAGSGKAIDRDLIICILHNIATSHQRLLQIDKCMRYVEGLIFNLDNHLQSLHGSDVSQENNVQAANLAASQGIQVKRMLTTYLVRFCALNSQRGRHQHALAAARRAVQMMGAVITSDQSHLSRLLRRQGESKVDLKVRLILQLIETEHQLPQRRRQDLLKATHYSIQMWNNAKMKPHHYDRFKGYSIGDMMQLLPMTHPRPSLQLPLTTTKKHQPQHFHQSVYLQLLTLSVGYFSVATELRLRGQQHLESGNSAGSMGVGDKAQAELYHLLSIMVVAAFVPIDILYLRHIISSYSNSFDSGLVDYQTVQVESLEKMLNLVAGGSSSGARLKSPKPGSTQIIGSESVIRQGTTGWNEYRLRDLATVVQKQNRKKHKHNHRHHHKHHDHYGSPQNAKSTHSSNKKINSKQSFNSPSRSKGKRSQQISSLLKEEPTLQLTSKGPRLPSLNQHSVHNSKSKSKSHSENRRKSQLQSKSKNSLKPPSAGLAVKKGDLGAYGSQLSAIGRKSTLKNRSRQKKMKGEKSRSRPKREQLKQRIYGLDY